jgi:imidazolonepropionase-like amidohydrolase
VVFAMGYDSGPPGCQLWEAHRMAVGGLGTMAALRAATLGGALALGIEDIGRLAPGAVADVIVVDGDPLADIRLLLRPNRILRVYRGGVAIGGTEITGRRDGGDDEIIPSGPPSPCCMPGG